MAQFSFQNTGELVYNDVVLPGAAYRLQNINYTFLLNPTTEYWRFGLRIGKSEQISFFHPNSRYAEPEFAQYIDIHLSAGEWNNNLWEMPGRLQFGQYNIPGKDHLLYRCEYFSLGKLVSMSLELDTVNESLNIVVETSNCNTYQESFKIPPDYRYFKLFAWADKKDFKLDCEIKATSLVNGGDLTQSESFRVGHIIFRLGDMFDRQFQKEHSLFLLPAATDGSAMPYILNRASELQIPYPTSNKPGSVFTFTVSDANDIYAGYAYSVNKSKSSAGIIREVCQSILQKTDIIKIHTILLPLFGTGAGNMSEAEVAGIYDEEFNSVISSPEIIVSVRGRESFNKVKGFFAAKAEWIKGESELGKPDRIINLEKRLGTTITETDYTLDNNEQIIALRLDQVIIDNSTFDETFNTLETLSISNGKDTNYSFIGRLRKLRSLYLNACSIRNLDFLHELPELTTLDLGSNGIADIRFLSTHVQLQTLYLRENEIIDIRPLASLKNLQNLDISKNQVVRIEILSLLSDLAYLNLSHNRIEFIFHLVSLRKLRYLDVSNNRINGFDDILIFQHLDWLKADSNPGIRTLQLNLDANQNHLATITSLIRRNIETDTTEFILPAKVILMGNHGTGKSSLLHYLVERKLSPGMDSTHIIKILSYPQGKAVPEAIFFDFGGQDYYHGIYKAFLSGGSVYLLLWNKATDVNELREDSNRIFTRHFTVNYWLSQKKSFEGAGYYDDQDPLLAVQSYADKDKRAGFITGNSDHRVDNEFFVTLRGDGQVNESWEFKVNETALQYLKESVHALIEEKRIIKKEPRWYIDFIEFILKQNTEASHIPKSVENDVLPMYKRSGPDVLELLKADLDQLHSQGLILYYQNELPDTVWLNPVAFVEYIHQNILRKDKIKSGRIDANDIRNYDSEVINILYKLKILFSYRDEKREEVYIVPNFLPLADGQQSDSWIYKFGLNKPLLVMKFKDFLPFGLINQAISFFGFQQEHKMFWRDQLIFTFEQKAKILLQLDFQHLEIKMYGTFENSVTPYEKADITGYLFYVLLSLYWDMHPAGFEDYTAFMRGNIRSENYLPEHDTFNQLNQVAIYEDIDCYPHDLYISINDMDFIYYPELFQRDNQALIASYSLNSERILGTTVKPIPVYAFQPFTKKSLKRKKKVVISYSKKDLVPVNKFKLYLQPLIDEELIDPAWYCSELIAGEEWNEEIQKKFAETDIVFFMVSENMMANKYVKDEEIKRMIDRWDARKDVKIISVILVPYLFERSGTYNLSRFVCLPYAAEPVSSFDNDNDAWYYISLSIKLMIEKDLYPEKGNEQTMDELKKLQEEIMK